MSFLKDLLKPDKEYVFRSRLKIEWFVGKHIICKFNDSDWQDILVKELSPSGLHILLENTLDKQQKQITVTEFINTIIFPKEQTYLLPEVKLLYTELFNK